MNTVYVRTIGDANNFRQSEKQIAHVRQAYYSRATRKSLLPDEQDADLLITTSKLLTFDEHSNLRT